MTESETPSNTCIRRASRADLDLLVEVDKESDIARWSARLFLEELANSHSLVLVYEVSGSVIAYVVTQIVLDEGHILKIAVRRAFRRQGVGRRLIDAITAEAKAVAVTQLHLEVRVNNLPALGLYTTLGFEEIGRRKAYYTDTLEDAILMRKSI